MKTKTLIAAAMILLSLQSAEAQKYFSDFRSHSHANLDRAAKYYLASLDAENEGVVESALAHIARMKMYFPEMAFEHIAAKVADLSVSGSTPRIRYQAYLVNAIFSTPSVFAEESRRDYESPEALFSAVAERLRSTLLGTTATFVE
jgi:hypothetical protein